MYLSSLLYLLYGGISTFLFNYEEDIPVIVSGLMKSDMAVDLKLLPKI